MPVNCTQCGAPLEKGARFCTGCGAPVAVKAPRPETKPEMDLSEFFDEPTAAAPAEPRRKAPAQTAARRPARETEARPRKNDRVLNIALLVLGVLAVAVLTFVVILLFAGGNKNSGGEPQGSTVVVPSSEPVVAPSGQPVIVPPGTVQPTTPIVVVTPSPVPTAAPTPTPTPTPAPDYLLPESNSRYLTESDLSGLTHEQLCFARNEIFARHGRIFKTPEIAAYFNSKTWYHGTISAENFSESVFNTYERTNIGFIRDYENKHYGGSYY